MLQKTGMPHFNKFVWAGVGMGLFISSACGVGIVAAYYLAQGALLDYRQKAAFSGTFSLIASLFLTGLAVQFLRFKDIEVKYRRKLASGLQKAKVKPANQATFAIGPGRILWSDSVSCRFLMHARVSLRMPLRIHVNYDGLPNAIKTIER